MSFIRLLEGNRGPLLSLALALALAGLFAGFSLPVGLFPVTAFPGSALRWTRAACPPSRC